MSTGAAATAAYLDDAWESEPEAAPNAMSAVPSYSAVAAPSGVSRGVTPANAAAATTATEAAWLVAMDVETGAILALANRPTQNPNDTAQIQMALFKNRAALDAYEPGSVFKPLPMVC